MILLGAGSSVPFGIPAMTRFVQIFKDDIKEKPLLTTFLLDIEQSLKDSKRLIGYNVQFDLESLMVILEDIATETEKPLSPPTFALTLHLLSKKEKTLEDFSISGLRKLYKTEANELLLLLQNMIFDKCIEPIEKGQKESYSFSFLDIFYGPLFTLIDKRIAPNSISWIFTTNWDLCLKQWLEYAQIAFDDGTGLDDHRKTVLNPYSGWNEQGNSNVKIVPLHGSFDLIKGKRFVQGGTYSEIQKVSNPEIYFEGKRSELSKAFIVYPFEAVGYDQTIKSPYLDMLVQLKRKLREEGIVYVVGFSFRDSIIASIFDEVVREKLERGQSYNMKVVLIDSSPDIVVENLRRQGYMNIANVITKVQVSFPNVLEYSTKNDEIKQGIRSMLEAIAQKMVSENLSYDRSSTNNLLAKYGLQVSL